MGQASKSVNVPKAMQEKYEAIVELTNSFSDEKLNEEYAQLIRYAVAALCRKRPSPLDKGKASSWACGIDNVKLNSIWFCLSWIHNLLYM